jgi:hypothetical protein
MLAIKKCDVNIVFIDEYAVNENVLSPYSWYDKDRPNYILS